MSERDKWQLVYKGEGDYDVRCCPGVTIELSYDGSDYMVGDWTFWNLNIGGERLGGVSILSHSPFTEWLEEQARKDGHLPDEPVLAHPSHISTENPL